MSRMVNEGDPRVQRTHQLLLDAFMSLVQERHHIQAISIQEIALRARVNRATFYAHFADKYELVMAWSRDKFRRGLAAELSPASGLRKETLGSLILAMFDFMAESRRYYRPSNRPFELVYEMAIQQELYDHLLRWIKQARSEDPLPAGIAESTAEAISWAIFGPAVRWSRGDLNISKAAMVEQVLAVVVAGLSPVVTLA